MHHILIFKKKSLMLDVAAGKVKLMPNMSLNQQL